MQIEIDEYAMGIDWTGGNDDLETFAWMYEQELKKQDYPSTKVRAVTSSYNGAKTLAELNPGHDTEYLESTGDAFKLVVDAHTEEFPAAWGRDVCTCGVELDRDEKNRIEPCEICLEAAREEAAEAAYESGYQDCYALYYRDKGSQW